MTQPTVEQLQRQLAESQREQTRLRESMRQQRDDHDRELRRAKRYPVINGHQTGPYTGRCHQCGSTDLWDDCTAYGCNKCSMTLVHG